jgi:hypothetical protein
MERSKMTIPPLPQFEPDPERTIDELIALCAATGDDYGPEYLDACEELVDRQVARDWLLDLQDQINDAHLVLVPEADWIAGREAVERLAAIALLAKWDLEDRSVPPAEVNWPERMKLRGVEDAKQSASASPPAAKDGSEATPEP